MKISKRTPFTQIDCGHVFESLRTMGLSDASVCDAVGIDSDPELYVWQVIHECKDLPYEATAKLAFLSDKFLGTRHNWPVAIQNDRLVAYALEYFKTRRALTQAASISHRVIYKLESNTPVRFSTYMSYLNIIVDCLPQENIDECFEYVSNANAERLVHKSIRKRVNMKDVKPKRVYEKRITLGITNEKRKVIDTRISLLNERAEREGLSLQQVREGIKTIYHQVTNRDVCRLEVSA